MVNVPSKNSTYSDYLYTCIDQLTSGGGAFTLKQLAEYAGLKITPSMRRRVRHCVFAGTLHSKSVLAGQRGSHIVYWKPTPVSNEEIPF